MNYTQQHPRPSITVNVVGVTKEKVSKKKNIDVSVQELEYIRELHNKDFVRRE